MLAALSLLTPTAVADSGSRTRPEFCTYELRVWNVFARSSAGPFSVRHPYRDLDPAEIDGSTGCTVCSEDQREVNVPPLPPVYVCYKIVPQVRAALERLAGRGSVVDAISGYRVIRSRGPVDGEGNRSRFSNHAFGTAIDINPDRNGLYDTCITFGPECRLLRGGPWMPGERGALTPDGDVVRSFRAAGFKWGGEIEGNQKDFMHFSPTGY